ncbi:MAG: hypothetical protein AAB696_02210 [Patescibacteria group bacterium]
MILKSAREILWTKHAQSKMRFYGLSKQRVRRVLHSPKRTEEGIAPNTAAMMQVAGSEKHPYEIWVMVQKSKIISAWKYPGRTKIGEPLPFEILEEIKNIS